VLVPEGEYELRGVGAQIRPTLGGKLKLFVDLEIINDPHAGQRVQFIASIPGDGFVSPASAFFEAWTIANGGRPPRRTERMTPAIFVHRLLLGRVRTVTTDHRKRSEPDHLRYSIVAEFLR
jgi:hypothetical protein